MMYYALIAVLMLLVFAVYRACVRRAAKDAALPPGPPPIPFIGNLHQFPRVNPFETFKAWSKIYGNIFYFHLLGRQFVVLNDLKSAVDLFEKRSTVYCTKPRLIMAGELVGKEKTSIVFSTYTPRLKECRRIVHSWMNKQSLEATYTLQEAGSVQLMAVLMKDPLRFSEHIRTRTGAALLRLLYGIRCLPQNDPHLMLSEHVSALTAEAMRPGRWLCDSFPAMAHVPAWFPGAYFKRWAAETRRLTNDLIFGPYIHIKEDVIAGKATPSWVAGSIMTEDGQLKSGEDEYNLMVASGSLYAAGIDTTVSLIRAFYLMMALNPDVQRRAQEEVDRVVGRERLPDLSDRDSLPYLSCITKEVLRITAIAPILPHSLDGDDVYEGYLIPKGAWVMVNAWAIFHDPEVYPEPYRFNPDRFDPALGAAVQQDPNVMCFGMGRRTCVGVNFAKSWTFLCLARTLAVFDIRPSKAATRPLEAKFVAQHIRKPDHFEVDLIPRSVEQVALVEQMLSATQDI